MIHGTCSCCSKTSERCSRDNAEGAEAISLGYSIIAVPTGRLSAELSEAKRKGPVSTQACPNRSTGGHDWDVRHCKYCGVPLNE